MSKTIESTVEKLSQDLAEAGVMGSQHVFVTVLDDEEVAKLDALRADLQVGLDDLDAGRAGPLDIDAFIAELHESHAAKSPLSAKNIVRAGLAALALATAAPQAAGAQEQQATLMEPGYVLIGDVKLPLATGARTTDLVISAKTPYAKPQNFIEDVIQNQNMFLEDQKTGRIFPHSDRFISCRTYPWGDMGLLALSCIGFRLNYRGAIEYVWYSTAADMDKMDGVEGEKMLDEQMMHHNGRQWVDQNGKRARFYEVDTFSSPEAAVEQICRDIGAYDIDNTECKQNIIEAAHAGVSGKLKYTPSVEPAAWGDNYGLASDPALTK